MAEGLARRRLGDRIHVESAGVAPAFEGAQPDAVEVMRALYGVDISSHRTRSVFVLDLGVFDWIIALDAYVFDMLTSRYPDRGDRLVLWDIDDPFGRPRAAYERSARLIEYCLGKFLSPKE
jgi:protein-tyrosine-phosphatase